MNKTEYDDFEASIKEKFPGLLAEHYGGICTGPGCWPLIESTLDSIQKRKLAENLKTEVVQIKEKFGLLRIYCRNSDEHIDTVLVHNAEVRSSRICEACGQPGTNRPETGYYVFCETHYEEYKKVLNDES